MTPRSIRRAIERKAKKEEARKLRQFGSRDSNEASSQNQTSERQPAGNARNHGFRGDFFLAPAEDPAEWERLKDQLVAEWQPLTKTERNLVQMLAENFWLRKRSQMLAIVCEQRTGVPAEIQMKQVDMYYRRAERHERGYAKCRKELEAIRRQRDKEAIGFERQIREANQEHRRAQLHEVKLQMAQAKLELLKPSETHLAPNVTNHENPGSRAKAA